MKTAISLAFIIIMTVSGALAQLQYPPELPQNFENAPLKASCERVSPTAIGIKRFVHPTEKWVVEIYARNKDEILLGFVKFPPTAYLSLNEVSTPGIEKYYIFVKIGDAWVNADSLTKSELEAYDKKWLHLSAEEFLFANSCIDEVANKQKSSGAD